MAQRRASTMACSTIATAATFNCRPDSTGSPRSVDSGKPVVMAPVLRGPRRRPADFPAAVADRQDVADLEVRGSAARKAVAVVEGVTAAAAVVAAPSVDEACDRTGSTPPRITRSEAPR